MDLKERRFAIIGRQEGILTYKDRKSNEPSGLYNTHNVKEKKQAQIVPAIYTQK